MNCFFASISKSSERILEPYSVEMKSCLQFSSEIFRIEKHNADYGEGCLTYSLLCRLTNNNVENEKRKIILCLTYFFVLSLTIRALYYMSNEKNDTTNL